jgi:hypothetical protein
MVPISPGGSVDHAKEVGGNFMDRMRLELAWFQYQVPIRHDEL